MRSTNAAAPLKQWFIAIESGGRFDAAILTSAIIDDLSRQQLVTPDSRRDLARVGVGVGAAAGAAPASLGTVEAFKTHTLNQIED